MGKNFRRSLCSLAAIVAVSALLMQANAQKPSLKGTDLLCNGESFFAMSNICSELTKLAQADGVLPQGESFKQVAVSGQPIATILNQFKNANPKPKYLVTDGGGIDLMSSNCQAGDTNCATVQNLKKVMKEYIAEMVKSGVKSFLWMGYPEPTGQFAGALKTGQAIWSIVAKGVMDTTTKPYPLWVDLRTTWAGHYSEYTSDGIHCTDAGGRATAKAFWEAMKANNWAFFNAGASAVSNDNQMNSVSAMKPVVENLVVSKGNAVVSLSVNQPSNVSLRLITLNGRTVFTGQQYAALSGMQKVSFPLSSVARGVYQCEIKTGQLKSMSTLFVQ